MDCVEDGKRKENVMKFGDVVRSLFAPSERGVVINSKDGMSEVVFSKAAGTYPEGELTRLGSIFDIEDPIDRPFRDWVKRHFGTTPENGDASGLREAFEDAKTQGW